MKNDFTNNSLLGNSPCNITTNDFLYDRVGQKN